MFKLFCLNIFLFTSAITHAWDGYDYSNGNYVEIDSGNLVRSGESIEVYESGKGYTSYDVESVTNNGGDIEVEVYDYDSGEYKTFSMDD